MAQRLLDAFSQYFSNGGEVLTDGQLRFCVSGGSTSDLLDTFSDINLENPNANPLPLEAGGRVPDCFGYNRYYKIILEFTDGTKIQEFDPVGGPSSGGEFGPWNNELVYNKNQIVTHSNRFWRSVDNGNQGNEPSTTSDWIEIKFIQEYSSSVAYSVGDYATYDGGLYKCVQAATGQNPNTAHAYWQRMHNIPHWGSTATYRQYDLAIDSNGVVQVSQQNSNTNHNPVGDSGTWWMPYWATIPNTNTVLSMSGGGTLTARYAHELTDSSTYTLPAANSVPANTILQCFKTDTNRTAQPVVQRAGSDLIQWSGGTDTTYTFDYGYSRSRIFKSNGVDRWRV